MIGTYLPRLHRLIPTGAALLATLAVAQAARGQSDSAAVVGVVAAYHTAMQAGDSVQMLALLAEDVRILEGAGIEDKQKFRSGHLRADINYAKAVKSERAVTGVVVSGTSAWVVSSSSTTGEYNGRAVNSRGAETMVLSRDSGGWKIRLIHWSSGR